MDLWIVPTRSPQKEEMFRIGLVDCPKMAGVPDWIQFYDIVAPICNDPESWCLPYAEFVLCTVDK